MGCGGGCCGGHEEEMAPEPVEVKPAEPLPDGKVVLFTELAVSKVKEIMQSEGKADWGLRVEAIPGGCAGFTYNMEFEKSQREGDTVQEENGVKVFVDPMSRQMLHGAKINFMDGLQGSGFVFDNPNAKSGCGCGKSFG